MAALQVSCPAPGVGQILMDRPAVFNAFDEAMIAELDEAFARLAVDDSARVTVLAGRMRGTEEARGGFAAFLAKRAASWFPQ